MAPRMGEGRVIPVRDMERERAAAAPSEVKTYTLPPEEIERIFSRNKTGDKNKTKELVEVNMTKEQYLQERIAGKNRNSIIKEHFNKNTTAFYRRLKEWGIKDPIQEEAAIAEHQQVAQPKEDPNSTYQAIKTFADKDLHAEIERLRDELGKTRVHRDDLKSEIEKYEGQIDRLKGEIKDWMATAHVRDDEIVRLRRANDDIKADSEQLRANYADAIEQETERLRKEIDRLRDDNETYLAEIRLLDDELSRYRDSKPPVTGEIEWFTPETIRPEPTVSISKDGVNFDPEATKAMGLAAGDAVKVGFADGRMVMRKSEDGFKLQRGTDRTVRFASLRLAKWPRFQAVPKGKHALQRDRDGLFFVEVRAE